MDDLRELYQELILDHYKRPRNFRIPADATHQANGDNPLCGDRITVYLKLAEDAISEIGFQGTGCAICTAAASLMTESVKGKSQADVGRLFKAYHDVVTGTGKAKGKDGGNNIAALGKLAAFAGVSEFPIRIKCATLPWHTLRAALALHEEPVTTE